MTLKIRQDGRDVVIGAGAVLASLTSVTLGAAIAKSLFPLVGAFGITSLRIGLGAILLLLFRRPWRRAVPADLRWPLIAYGATLGVMNVLIYQAFARIPIGIAIGIEVIGPLAVVLFGSRRPRDFMWLAAAAVGLALLLPLHSDAPLDPLGVAFALAAAACWAFYIVSGKRVSGALGGDAVAWGMLVAAVLILPVGLVDHSAALFRSHVLLLGLAIACLSSAVPYSLDMEAMRRLPAPVFGLMVSSAPAVGAVIGFFLLGERLTPLQWIAILLIMVASGGSALTMGRNRG
ncbi:EamA family transporter [Sphingobium sp. CAP-1]|uniref:EamA family transporter n=1 Tax=Sphingobium sp. CAP-1 TaxID=2676077 RepID=UPI0012BB2243|nr:EamA family transporter [Sphingobium sp. CAP-1]QGP80817.1 EamA family transporter [Sphingobium sp. CAP-1]